jgi:chromate reductase
MVKLLFLAGSLRKDSYNKKLAKVAFEIAKKQGVTATYIDLKDFEMPIYDGDDEAATGLPENAKKLKKLFVEHDGFFIASPEYNSSFSAALKNSLDWISRKHEADEGNLVAFTGKVAALGAASMGALGGLRGLVPLRMLLGNINVQVTPHQIALGQAHTAFDDSGNLKEEKNQKFLTEVVTQLAETAKALKK